MRGSAAYIYNSSFLSATSTSSTYESIVMLQQLEMYNSILDKVVNSYTYYIRSGNNMVCLAPIIPF